MPLTSEFWGGPEVYPAAAGQVLFWGYYSSEKWASSGNRRGAVGVLSESDRDLAVLINGPIICSHYPATTLMVEVFSLQGWDCSLGILP